MFDFKLYKEGLRRSMPLSMLFIAIMMLGAILTPFNFIAQHQRSVRDGFHTMQHFVTGIFANPVMPVAMALFAPFLTLFLFSFLNKRASSDFFHVIPHKRESLFTSFTAAALTWVLGGIWLCTAVTLIITHAAGDVFIVNTASVLLAALGLSAGSFLVMAAVLISMSVTGGLFANVVGALLILFLPRMILEAFFGATEFATQILAMARWPGQFGFMGTATSQIPFNFVINAGGFVALRNPGVIFTYGILYTFVLGVIYTGLAVWLFKRRKSELAGSSSSNRTVHMFIRVLIAFAISMMATMEILRGVHPNDTTSLIAVYAAAVIVYFAYELITARKFVNFRKYLPGLGLLVVLNLSFGFGASVVTNIILNNEIRAEDVRAIRIVTLHQTFGGINDRYQDARSGEVPISDDELNAVLLGVLNRNIDDIRERAGISEWQRSVVEFETQGGRTLRRAIRMSSAEMLQVIEILGANEDFRRAYMSMPESPELLWSRGLSEAAVSDVYQTLRREVLDMDFMDFIAHVMGNRFVSDVPPFDSLGVIEAQGFIGSRTFFNIFQISSKTPETADVFIRHINAENFEATLEFLRNADDPSASMFVGVINPEVSWVRSTLFVDPQNDPEVIRLLEEAVLAQQGVPVDINEPMLFIDFHSLQRVMVFAPATARGFVQGHGLFYLNAGEELIELLGS